MDHAERELVRASMRQLLTTTAPAKLPAQLLDSGWAELLDDDPATAVSVLAEEQGRSVTAAPTLDLILLHAAGVPLDAATAFVLPTMRRRLAPTVRSVSGRVHVDGLVLAGAERADRYVAVREDALVAVPAAVLDLRPLAGGDAQLGLSRVTGEVAAAADATVVAPAEVWANALAAGRRSLAGELVGLVDRMLDDTVAYVLDRHQFGRPIAAFQAVKHRLADVRVAARAARSALGAAWTDGDPVSALAAKALAGRAHRLASANCQQVHGGIAFTVEHGFHRFIRRGQMLDALLGSAEDLVRELGRGILDAGQVPRTPSLRPDAPIW